jgi:alkylation response protein AidB-like acyl-CoA dehydrogenase
VASRQSPVAVTSTDFSTLASPTAFLQRELRDLAHGEALREYERWWEREGKAISAAVDRAQTPWVRMFDAGGRRVDELLYIPDYWRMLKQGYRSGVIWRSFEDQSLLPSYLFLYVTGFYDPGLACPYTVSLSTAVPLSKYADTTVRDRFLSNMLRRDDSVWQGATWMTEIKGGSDLGAAVETVARPAASGWLLTGDKYFASNAGAELAVVAARPEGAPRDVRGLALFLVPRYRDSGELNYTIRRLKDKIATRSVPTGEVELRDSEGWLLGSADHGIYRILEVLNISRVANSVGSVALAQRAMADALAYAQQRRAFGRRIIEHPLFAKEFQERLCGLRAASALAWYAVRLLDSVWKEQAPYSDRYHLFRLVAHLAKYWTAEFAVQTAKWAMEAHGGLGTLAEFGVERWLREAMILAIWEGTSHRQVLDGIEVMERKRAHQLLLNELAQHSPSADVTEMQARIREFLALPEERKQSTAGGLFSALAQFTATSLVS